MINQNCDVKENEQNLTREEARQINEMCLQKLQRYWMKYFMLLTVYIWKVWALWQMLVNVAMTNIWSLQCCFFYGGKKTGEKPSEQGKNQQKTQPSCDARSRIQTRVTLVEGERSNHCTILVPHISIHPLGFLLWNKNILQMILVLHFSYSHYTRVRWDLCHI